MQKHANGVYYTVQNPFSLRPFKNWAEKAKIKDTKILEPFAGANNIIQMLEKLGMCNKSCSFDIKPKHKDVQQQNTLKKFPNGYKVCITNPPWLTNYSAKRRGVRFPKHIKYDDVYKYCLELALEHCEYVAFIIPATFLRTNLFRDRLSAIIFIHSTIFTETENPVCLALFNKKSNDAKVYYDNKYLGRLSKLEKCMPEKTIDKDIKFNSSQGQIGLHCIDNTKESTIRFCLGKEIKRKVVHSDRLITRIYVPDCEPEKLIPVLNERLLEIRKKTNDVFFSPFKGLRKDGKYRRRVDYEFVRNLIADVR